MADRFDLALRRWDVARFLRQHVSDIAFTESNQVYTECPECHRFKLYVDLKTKLWICQRCGARGNGTSLIMAVAKVDYVEALQVILRASPLVEEEQSEEIKAPVVINPASLPPNFHKLTLPADNKSRSYWDYLVDDRHLAPSLVMHYEMGYVRVGRMKGRVIIPIKMHGQLHGWLGRATFDTEIKYWNEPSMKSSELLFNIDALEGQEEAILMEGVFDALRLPQQAVCTFGKKISRAQIDLLIDLGVRRVILCYDGDALRDNAIFACRLPPYMEAYVAELPPEYDPGNVPMMHLDRAIQNPRPMDLNVNDSLLLAPLHARARPKHVIPNRR